MASDGQIVINTKLNDHGLKQGITGLQDTTITALNKVKGVLATVGIGVSVAAAVKGVNNLMKGTVDLTDRIDKQSQRLGMSRRGYQEWNYILAQNDISVDNLQISIKTLSTAIDEASNGSQSYIDTLARLGFKQEDITRLAQDQEKAFGEVFTALTKVSNGTERSTIATKLLGRAATDLAPALNGGADAVDELRKRAYELGLVLDDNVVNTGVKLSNAMTDISMAMKNAGARAITPLVGKVEELALSFIDTAIPAIENFLSTTFKVGLSVPPIFSFMKATIVAVLREISDALEEPLNKLLEFVDTVLNLPAVRNVVDIVLNLAGDIRDGLSKGIKTGDWSDFWRAATGVAQFAIGIYATIQLASMAGAQLWTLIQGSLGGAGFSTVNLAAGMIAGVSVAVALVEAIQGGGWSKFADNLSVAIAGGLIAAGLTKSPQAGMWVATILLNFKVGESVGNWWYKPEVQKWIKPLDIVGNTIDLIKGIGGGGKQEGLDLSNMEITGIETFGTNLGIAIDQSWRYAADEFKVKNTIANDLMPASSKADILLKSTELGAQIVAGLKDGSDRGIKAFAEENAELVLMIFRDTWGIKSPSTETTYFGKMMIDGLINGLVDRFPELKAEAEKMRDELAKIWTDVSADSGDGGGGGGGSPIAIKPGFGDIWSDTKAGWKAALDDMKRDAEDWTTFTKNIFASIPGAFGNAIAQGMRSLGQNLAEQTEIIAQLEDSILSLEDKLADSYDDLEDAQKAYAKAVLSGDSDAIRNAEKRVRQQEKIISGHEKSLKALKDEKKSVEDGSKAWKDFARTILNALANELYGLGAQLAARAILSALTWNWAGAAMATAGSAAAFGAAILVDSWAGSFAEGGIVPQVAGLPSSGDRHVASVNPGELILNAAQQQSIATQLAVLSKLTEIIAAMTIATNGTGPYIDLRGSTFNALSEEEVGKAIYRNIKTLQHEGVLEAW